MRIDRMALLEFSEIGELCIGRVNPRRGQGEGVCVCVCVWIATIGLFHPICWSETTCLFPRTNGNIRLLEAGDTRG